MPWRFSRGGIGSLPDPTARPITATRFWSFGQLDWYAYERVALLAGLVAVRAVLVARLVVRRLARAVGSR